MAEDNHCTGPCCNLSHRWAFTFYSCSTLRHATGNATCTNLDMSGGAPKERQRRRAEKRLSKSMFLESPFLLCLFKVFRTFQVFLRANLKGAEKKRTLQKHPFGQPFLRTTPSPLLWRTLNEVRSLNLPTCRVGPRKLRGCLCNVNSPKHNRLMVQEQCCYNIRERKLSTNSFFLKLLGPPGCPGEIPGYPAKKVWFPWLRGTYRTLRPPPLHVEDPHPTRTYPDQKV